MNLYQTSANNSQPAVLSRKFFVRVCAEVILNSIVPMLRSLKRN